MRTLITTFAIVLILLATQPLNAQNQKKTQQFSIETEPVAFILCGAGITCSYQHGSWSYSIEAFREFTVPESLHGNRGFDTSQKGVELQIERFLTGTDGFYEGSEIWR